MAKLTPEEIIKSKTALTQAMRDIQTVQGISVKFPTKFAKELGGLMFETSPSDKFLVKHSDEAFDRMYKSIHARIAVLNKRYLEKEPTENEGFVDRLTKQRRFSRINSGSGGSSLLTDLLDQDQILTQKIAQAARNGPLIRNIWYYMIPYIGEGAYHVYDRGPGEASEAESCLWDLLFDGSFDLRHYIFKSQNHLIYNPAIQSNQAQSGENLAQFVLELIQDPNPKFVYFRYDLRFFKLCIAIIRLAKLEQSLGGSNFTNYSSQLLKVIIDHSDIRSSLEEYGIWDDVKDFMINQFLLTSPLETQPVNN